MYNKILNPINFAKAVIFSLIISSLLFGLPTSSQASGPTAVDDEYDVPNNTSTNLFVMENDIPDGLNSFHIDNSQCTVIITVDELDISLQNIFSVPAHADVLTQPPVTAGTVTLNTLTAPHSFTFTPVNGFTGTISFTYEICQTGAPSSSATVTLNIFDNLPIAVDDNATTTINTPVDIDVMANDSSPNGTNPVFIDESNCIGSVVVSSNELKPLDVTTNPSNGTAVLNTSTAPHTITYTPSQDFVGTDSFTYTICTEDLSNDINTTNYTYATATVNVTIAELQDPIIEIFKDKEDGTVEVGDTVKIQIDITNPNDVNLMNLETVTTVDLEKVSIVPNSVSEGVISGTKFSSLFSLPVSAQSTFNSSISGDTVNISFDTLLANETRSFTFDVTSLTTGIGQFDTQVSVDGIVTSTDTTTIPVDTEIQTDLLRTGGYNEGQNIFKYLIVLFVLLTGFKIFKSIKK